MLKNVDILIKRKEAQMLADVLPECPEQFQLQQMILACDYALDLLKNAEGVRFEKRPPAPTNS